MLNNKKMTVDPREYRDVISVIIRYGNLYARYSKKIGDFGTGFPVSLFDMQVLESVYLNEDNFMKMAELAEKLGMTQSAFSKNINKLEELGLVNKYRFENNKKDIFLRLTEKGKEAYELHGQYVYDKIFSRAAPILQEMPDECIHKFCEVLDIMGEFSHLLGEKEEQTIKLIPVNESK